MARKKFWLGGTGPFYYDDAAAVLDSRATTPVTVNQAGIVSEGTITALVAPITGNDVLRLDDVGDVAGDIKGPTSATDNAIARFDGTTGKKLQNSTVIINDAGDVTGVGDLNLASGKVLKINSTQIVSGQQAAVANATGAGDVVAQLNTLLARLRAHGLIAT